MAAAALVGLGTSLVDNFWNDYRTQRQQDQNWQMYMYNNQYNSPEQQVKRLRAAGINPAMAMTQGMLGSGNSSAPANSVDPKPVDSSAVMEGLRISNESRLSRAQSAKLEQETEAERIRNKFALQREVTDLRLKLAQAGLTEFQKRLIDREIAYKEKELSAFDDLTGSTVRMNNAKARLDEANAQYQEIITRFEPDKQKKILKNLDAEYENIMSAVRANDANAAYHYAEKALSNARKEGVDIDNQLARDTADAVVDKAFSEADNAYWSMRQSARTVHTYKFAGKEFSDMHPNSPLTRSDYVRPSTSRKQSHVRKH